MKVIIFVLSAVFVIAFAGLAFAQDKQEMPVNEEGQYEKVVGDDIEISEGEFKIISIDEDEMVVGDDIEIGEDEVKIISIDENDLVVDEGDPGLISILDPDAVVGDDIDIGDDEAKIISIDEEKEGTNKPLFAGLSAGALVLAGAIFLIAKKHKQ